MKKLIIILFCFVLNVSILAQSPSYRYFDLVIKADSLYRVKDYNKSALTYSSAFKENGWNGATNDRYNAACSWALANVPDSAFLQLYRIATKANYSNYDHIIQDLDLNSLHSDERWPVLVDLVKQNRNKVEINLNQTLVHQLNRIHNDDQEYRKMMDSVEKKFGIQSNELKKLWRTIELKDSLNLIEVKALIDQYGWLGPEVIGEKGSSTLFLVIQHADLQTQEKYLPLMREAVKIGKAKGAELALLEDRVAIRNNKKQIFGSQITRDINGNYVIYPIEDEVNVNKRRAQVGLQPLEIYAKNWGINYTLPSNNQKDKARHRKSKGKRN